MRSAFLPDFNFKAFAKIIFMPECIAFHAQGAVLTDDWAPVEHMTDKMFWKEFVKRLGE